MSPDGTLHETGVPAPLVTAYLEQRGIVVARTTDFIILFLFSIGITKVRFLDIKYGKIKKRIYAYIHIGSRCGVVARTTDFIIL
jgi:hypothetical protein